MSNKTLMTLTGSKLLSNTWKQELLIKEDGVHGESLKVGKRLKMHLPYENIAQVNVLRGVFSADIEIVNKGGSGNLIVKALDKDEAEKAKKLIEKKRSEVQSADKTKDGNSSSADEIKKFADLRDQKVITEKEFQAKKKQILGL